MLKSALKNLAMVSWISLGVGLAAGEVRASGATDATEGSKAVVEKLHDGLKAAMKAGEEAGFDGRYALLEPIVAEAFDIDLISRLVLSTHWTSLGDEQRAMFSKTLLELTTSQYADRFRAEKGQKFSTDSVNVERESVHVVRATYTDSRGKERKFDYQLRYSKEQWRIVNIGVDGVSDLALKRAEYVDLIEREGFDALIAKMQSNVAKMKEAKAADD